MPTTLVIGGGLSGLTLASLLRARGEDVTLLEADARLGGNVRSREVDGFLLEDGPNAFLDKEPSMRALVDALGLKDRLRPASPAANDRFLFRAGALRKLPASPPALLRSDALPFGARLRVLLEPFSRRGRGEDESLASFARRHVGKTATRIGIDAAQSGIFAGDPERLSAWAFPQLVELERAHRSLVLGMIRTQREKRRAGEPRAHPTLTTFDRGLSTLIDALGATLGGRARTGAPVQRVERAGGKWRALLEHESLEADRLLLATPADVAARLLEGADATLAALLSGIEYAPIAVVHVSFPEGASRLSPRGFGFLAPEVEGSRLLGAIFVSSVFPFRAPQGQHLVTCMIGGARHPERLALDDGSLQAICADELGRAIGLSQPPRLLQVNRWPRAIPQYTLGHRARVAEIDQALSARPGLHLAGNYLRGVGLNDCVREATALVQGLST